MLQTEKKTGKPVKRVFLKNIQGNSGNFLRKLDILDQLCCLIDLVIIMFNNYKLKSCILLYFLKNSCATIYQKKIIVIITLIKSFNI